MSCASHLISHYYCNC